MKKIYLTLIICFLKSYMMATTVNATFTINANGDDAQIDNFNPSNNYPNQIDYYTAAWTISGTPVTWRNLFRFDLSSIPTNATITDARLNLYFASVNTAGNGPHLSLTSSNQCTVQRVTSAWAENTVTWNNQPTVTNTDALTLAQSSSGTQDYLNMNVSNMVQSMISATNSNFGFRIKLTSEIFYARMIFASGDNPDFSKHPTLNVTYTIPGNNTGNGTTCSDFILNQASEDAQIDTYNPSSNYPNQGEYYTAAWTISGTPTIWRNLFKFDLSSIPANSTIVSAALDLHYANINSDGNSQHSSLTNSNQSVLQRVISPWTENTVTWNNQPSVTSTDQVVLAQSTSGTQDYLNINVTNMVTPMVNNPNTNYGFLIKLTSENYYAKMIFASGDNPDASKHPKLTVCFIPPAAAAQVPTLSEWALIVLGALIMLTGLFYIRRS